MATAQQAMVNHFTAHFLGGEGFATITAARHQAAQVLGRPVSPGTALAKQVDEAVEGAVVRAAQAILQTPALAMLDFHTTISRETDISISQKYSELS